MSALTPEQERALDRLAESDPLARVVGTSGAGWPVVRRGSGKTCAVNSFGRLVVAPRRFRS